jgi:hypothetical protein
MFNLLDLMRAAQGGAAMENMSQQFGLSLDQTRRSMEALMPAFALGFQRNAADPTGFANLLRMMGSGQYAGFFEQPGMAFSPRGRREGDTIIGQLFGPEVSRQVADQAAAWAGVAPDIMRQMMPTVATMLMGGLFKSAASEGLADMFEQFARVLRGGASAAPQSGRNGGSGAATDPFSAWTSMVGAMWGAPSSGPAQARAEPPIAGMPLNPFAPWAAMMTGALGGRAEPPTPDPPEPPEPPEPPAGEALLNPFAPWAAMMSEALGGRAEAPAPEPPRESSASEPPPELAAPEPPHDPFAFFSQMMETGLEVQGQYLANLQNIFDSYWGAGSERR